MKKDDLLEALKSPSMTFTVWEVQEMMDHELNKDPSEMDPEIIDICTEILHKEYYGTDTKTAYSNKKKRRQNSKTVKRVILVAAILFIAFIVGMPVYARYVYNDTTDKIVRFFDNHFQFDLRQGIRDENMSAEQSTNLMEEIQLLGLDDVLIPKALLSDEYSIEKTEDIPDELFRSVSIGFKNNLSDLYGYVLINIFEDKDAQSRFQQGDIGENYDMVEHLILAGRDVIVFGDNTSTVIVYTYKKSNYSIVLENCEFKTGVSIAETIN